MVAQMAVTALTRVTLIDGDVTDVIVLDGVITSIGRGTRLPSDAQVVDLAGYLLLPAAVEPHAHLDKAFLAETIANPTGDLMGAINAMVANRHRLNIAETVERAERAARLMAANGFSAIRTHADTTCEHGLTSVLALDDVRRRVADVVDVEIVALCGWPVVGPAGADQRSLLRDALGAGADLVGGCPHLEDDIEGATDIFLEIATEFGCAVDLHTDETLRPESNGLDVLARRVLSGFTLGVTASHCVSLGQQPIEQQRITADRVAEAGIHVVALPHTNLFLQGRDRFPVPRGLTSVALLRKAGVNVAAGADNLQDPFNPLGRACPFETASLMVLGAHDLPHLGWDSVSAAAARVLGHSDAGVVVGARADLIAIRAATVREAIAFGSTDRIVWHRGTRLG